MWCKAFLLVACLHLSATFPMKLLRVPKIYNALITTNQKLVPSEAFPASTGPVFQPVALSGDPVLLNPEAFSKQRTDTDDNTDTGADTAVPALDAAERPRGFSKQMPAPVVFYPRYNIYHQLPQSVFPYTDVFQPPPVVVPVQRSSPPSSAAAETADERGQETEAGASSAAAGAGAQEMSRSRGPSVGFVTNNSPAGIPSVRPPPPPVSNPSTSPVGPIPGL